MYCAWHRFMPSASTASTYSSWFSASLNALQRSTVLKKGDKSCGVQRQYSGTAGRIDPSTLLRIADRGIFRLCQPARAGADRPGALSAGTLGRRYAAAGVPQEIAFATKPQLGRPAGVRVCRRGAVCLGRRGQCLWCRLWVVPVYRKPGARLCDGGDQRATARPQAGRRLAGRRARGDAHDDSDYDIAVFLRDLTDRWHEIARIVPIVTDILYEDAAFVHAIPCRAGAYRERTPLMEEIRREGVDL